MAWEPLGAEQSGRHLRSLQAGEDVNSRLIICTLKKEAVVLVNDVIAPRPHLSIVLDWDHRAMMGAMAAGFLTKLKALLENPACLAET